MSNAKDTEPLARVSRETLLSILETLPSALFLLNNSGTIVYANASTQALIIAPPEEIIGKPLDQTLWWSGSPAYHEKLRAAIAQASLGETVHFEAMIEPKEGKDRALSATITRHMDADHHSSFIFAVTEHKRADEDIHTLIETLPQLVWIARPDGFVESGNQHLSTYLGVPLERFNGDQWFDFVHPDDRQKTWEVWQTALRTGHPHEVEHRVLQGSTHTFRWFLTRAMPHKDAQGTILKWFGTSTNIDDQKRIEEALRKTQERVRALFDSSLIGMSCVEVEGEVLVEANEAFLQMSGYSQEDLDRRRLTRARITLPEDAPLFDHAHQELVACGQHTPFETELVCKDGSRLPILVGGVLFQDYSRQVVSFVLNNAARKELDRRKDDFISMASHELRNPLTALKLQTSLLHRQLIRQCIPAPDLSGMEVQINAVTRLVEELLDVSRIQAGGLEYIRERVDLDALLREIADTMQQTHPSHRILVEGAVQISLMADRDRLGQVFTNLLSNAIKYSPNAEVVEMILSASEDVVTVCVRDHGLGIPQEQREKIFERFYRAEGIKQRAISGLGMGLYIVAEIIKHYGGTIKVESTVGQGSTFTVTLPRTWDG